LENSLEESIIKHKIQRIIGRYPDKTELSNIQFRIKEIYEDGRKASLKEEEFIRILEEEDMLQ
jgi:hypothetical protein